MEANIKAIGSYNSILKNNIDTFLKDELKKCGHEFVKPSYGMILYLVFKENGKVQIKDLYNQINKNKPTISEMINRLVDLGYLVKETCTKDKRVTYVVATDKTKAFKDDFYLISDKLLNTVFKNFEEDEKEMLIKLLVKANSNFI